MAAMTPEAQLLMQEVLTELRAIREMQVEQGKEITRLRTLATVAGSIGGLVTGIATTLGLKVIDRG